MMYHYLDELEHVCDPDEAYWCELCSKHGCADCLEVRVEEYRVNNVVLDRIKICKECNHE